MHEREKECVCVRSSFTSLCCYAVVKYLHKECDNLQAALIRCTKNEECLQSNFFLDFKKSTKHHLQIS